MLGRGKPLPDWGGEKLLQKILRWGLCFFLVLGILGACAEQSRDVPVAVSSGTTLVMGENEIEGAEDAEDAATPSLYPCAPVGGGSIDTVRSLERVTVTTQKKFQRVTFEFQSVPDGIGALPKYQIHFIAPPFLKSGVKPGTSDIVVDMGEASLALNVVFFNARGGQPLEAQSYDVRYETVEPDSDTLLLPVTSVVWADDQAKSATMSWFVGLTGRHCPAVTEQADPAHLRIDFPLEMPVSLPDAVS